MKHFIVVSSLSFIYARSPTCDEVKRAYKETKCCDANRSSAHLSMYSVVHDTYDVYERNYYNIAGGDVLKDKPEGVDPELKLRMHVTRSPPHTVTWVFYWKGSTGWTPYANDVYTMRDMPRAPAVKSTYNGIEYLTVNSVPAYEEKYIGPLGNPWAILGQSLGNHWLCGKPPYQWGPMGTIPAQIVLFNFTVEENYLEFVRAPYIVCANETGWTGNPSASEQPYFDALENDPTFNREKLRWYKCHNDACADGTKDTSFLDAVELQQTSDNFEFIAFR